MFLGNGDKTGNCTCSVQMQFLFKFFPSVLGEPADTYFVGIKGITGLEEMWHFHESLENSGWLPHNVKNGTRERKWGRMGMESGALCVQSLVGIIRSLDAGAEWD